MSRRIHQDRRANAVRASLYFGVVQEPSALWTFKKAADDQVEALFLLFIILSST
jgi:hypothetical protein